MSGEIVTVFRSRLRDDAGEDFRDQTGNCATMCVMERVGVRELRQNLSVYLRRVQAGESLEVTEHGHPIAVLAPRRESESVYDHLVAEGRLRPGVGSIDDLPLPLGPVSTRGTDALAADRDGKE